MFREKCLEEGRPVSVSLITYRRIFCNNYNLSFFKPKKDQCQLCTAHENAKGSETPKDAEMYAAHIRRKEDCNTAKIKDKERAAEDANFMSVTFDLQSVLQIPSSDVSQMYYSRKLCVQSHNL